MSILFFIGLHFTHHLENMSRSIREVGVFMIRRFVTYCTARYYVDRINRSIRFFFPTTPCFFRLNFGAIARLAREIFASRLERVPTLAMRPRGRTTLSILAIRPREIQIRSRYYLLRPFSSLLLLVGIIVPIIYVLLQSERRQEMGIVLEISRFRITIRCVFHFHSPQNFYMVLFVEEY